MRSSEIRVLIMAAGTGGHIFPAISIAKQLKAKSADVEWLGTSNGMENNLLADSDIPLHRVSVSGLRGAGAIRKIQAPVMLIIAFLQSLFIILKVRPHCVLGMGGFVCGPAGIAAKILGKPLLIHEQNAVVGLTNRLLSHLANQVFEAYPNTFSKSKNAIFTGNPLRPKILQVQPEPRDKDSSMLRLLVLGGSQGALRINSVIPEFFSNYEGHSNLHLLHQTGEKSFSETVDQYENLGICLGPTCKVTPFIEEISDAYEWADVGICRSGASTVSELAAVGLPSILIPYPHHSDNQQLLNAKWLVNEKAAVIILQSEFNAQKLNDVLGLMIQDTASLKAMGTKARSMGVRDASHKLAAHCIKACYG